MSKKTVHKKSAGRPKVVRTNTITAKPIENIEVIQSDFIDTTKLQENILKNGVVSPLEFLVAVYMNDTVDTKLRVDAAKTATKYFHKALPVAVEHTGKDGKDLKIIHVQQQARAKLIEYLDITDMIDEDGEEHTVINGEVKEITE